MLGEYEYNQAQTEKVKTETTFLTFCMLAGFIFLILAFISILTLDSSEKLIISSNNEGFNFEAPLKPILFLLGGILIMFLGRHGWPRLRG